MALPLHIWLTSHNTYLWTPFSICSIFQSNMIGVQRHKPSNLSSFWGQNRSTSWALHLHQHPSLKTSCVEHVIAWCQHPCSCIFHIHRIHADHALDTSITRLYVFWSINICFCEASFSEVIILRREESLWNKEPRTQQLLSHQYTDLQCQWEC